MSENQISKIIKFTYNLEEGILNQDTIQNAEEIILQKLLQVKDFNYINLTDIKIDFITHTHEDKKFICRILIQGSHKLIFEDQEQGSDFLEVVRAAGEKATAYLRKENNKQGQH